MRHVTSFFIVVGFACVLAYSSSVHARAFYHCSTNNRTTSLANAASWSGDTASFRARDADFGSARKSALSSVVAQWNRAPQNLQVAVTYSKSTRSEHWQRNNNVSEIYFSDTACADGCAYIRASCADGIIEADVVLKNNPDVSFTNSSDKTQHFPYGGANKHIRNTLLHEIGHGLGLHHTSDTYSLMGDTYRHNHTNGTQSVPAVGEDDADTLVELYGVRSGAPQEVGVSHWRWVQAEAGGTGYSDNGYARLLDDAQNGIVGVPFGGEEKLYVVSRGQFVRPVFSFENTGRSSQPSVTIRYVLSASPTISTTAGTVLDERTINLARNTVYNPTNHRVRIPSNVIGTYYIGVLVDPADEIAEASDDPFDNAAPPASTGNAAYLPVFIQ